MASFRSVGNRRRRATPVITSTFENVSDIGVCLGLSLGVWSRNEVVRIDFEDCGSFRPGLADDLIGRSPFQGLQVLGEVVGGDEGQDMGLQAVQIVVVEDLDCGVLDRAVHSLGWAWSTGARCRSSCRTRSKM